MNAEAQHFIASVLALAPKTAAFDCDGTLWDADSGMEFFYWLLDHGLVDARTEAWARPRYQEYLAGRVDEKTMCGEMVRICRGIPTATIREASRIFFTERVEGRIFPEMLELTNRLREAGCELWAVSSSNQWLIETEAVPFGFAKDRVFAAAAEEKDGIATDRLIRVPTGPDKAAVLQAHTRVPPALAFGNSIHDVAMLDLATVRAFAINPNPDLAQIARQRHWTTYQPLGTRTSTR
ncbi:MAG: haloacid dehalogenase-like hydrolase [Candidatus Koribacter versatilis]|uniref:Haloacid dehalogenase-like hydrolase n=1 Tax=Candidatus Korobacter versatilis TaxID=658062 RepID=A0A932A696_9BACT|nr:haloacid dehalogenase-like hydrolase [Candidatus Koribacter versatilis]